MADNNDNENLEVPVGGEEGESQDPITPDDVDDEDEMDAPTESSTFEGRINVVIGSEQSAFIVDSSDEEYDGELNIATVFIPHMVSQGVLYVYDDEDKLEEFSVEYNEVLSDNEDNDWSYIIQLDDLDLTEVHSEDVVSFLFNVNNETLYKFKVVAHVTEENKLYFTDEGLNTPESNNNSSEEGGSQSGYDDDWLPSLEVDMNDNNNMTFQSRVFYEKGNEIYGAEVVLIPREDSNCPIETILITDKIKLDSFNGLVENMEKAYIPYTQDDVDNLEIYKKVASGELSTSSMEYKTIKWSKLHDKGDLKTILWNNIDLSTSEEEDYDKSNLTVINATHLNGYNSGEFIKLDDFDGLLSQRTIIDKNHETLQASTSRAGHAFIIDNLNETQITGGRVLSANQGRVLNEKIKSLEGTINNSWSKEKKINDNISYKVNEVLRLFICIFKKNNYTGLQSETGNHLLYGKDTIDSRYCPLSNVVTPLFRGDINLYFTPNGAVFINNLTRQSSIDINVQVMWHY